MRSWRLLLVTMLCLLAFSGVAGASYVPSQDLSVSVTLLPGVIQPSGDLGATTQAVQEGLHNTVTSLTGISIDHSYVWVNLNGASILAVDPWWVGW